MSRKDDHSFEISFYESVLKRDAVYVDVIEILGGLYTKVGRISDGLKMDRRLVRLKPQDGTAHYNLACSLALSDDKPAALKMLAHAIALGYDDATWMAKDPDLTCFKNEPVFIEMLAKLKQATAS